MASLTGHKLGPYLLPVIGAEVAAREFATALFLNACAVRDRDAVVLPTVHRLLGQVEASRQPRLETRLGKQ